MQAASISSQPGGPTQEGIPVQLYTLRNVHGCEARISNYGGLIVSLKTPDRHGQFDDVVLGFDKLEDYLTSAYLQACPYFGAFVGRYGNRIAKGVFSLDGREYRLPINNGPNTLHGGARGFDKRVWEAQAEESPQGPRLRLKYVSPDGEEGYPGTLTTTLTYTLTEESELITDMTAVTDKATVVNLTQHSYFNLCGSARGDILGHELMIDAKKYIPIDADSIPLPGAPLPVAGTPFDFTRSTAIGARIDADDPQLKNGMGYDHTFVFAEPAASPASPRFFARVLEPVSGRVLEMASTQPGVQFYSGNQLDGSVTGKAGVAYRKHAGFCLEPQHFPNSPNRPDYPSVVLRPGETYHHTIIYHFSVQP